MAQFHRGNIRASKLTPSQVYEMRSRYAAGETQGSLARFYQVTVGTVGRIVRGETWHQFDNPASEATGPVVFPAGPEQVQASQDRLALLLGKMEHDIARERRAEAALSEFTSHGIQPSSRVQQYLGTGQSPEETHDEHDKGSSTGSRADNSGADEAPRAGEGSAGETGSSTAGSRGGEKSAD